MAIQQDTVNPFKEMFGDDEYQIFIKFKPSITSRTWGKYWRPRHGDTFVCTYPKTGTTVVTWIMHNIRMYGKTHEETMVDFYEYVPWPMLSEIVNQDLNAPQIAECRLFKSHQPLSQIQWAPGVKYVVTVRDPIKTAWSFFLFLSNTSMFEVPAGKTDAEAFEMFVMQTPILQGYGKDPWAVFKQNFAAAKFDNVLCLSYESLLDDTKKETLIRQLVNFMDIDGMDENVIALVMENSTKEYMSNIMYLFDNSRTNEIVVSQNPVETFRFPTSPRVITDLAHRKRKLVVTENLQQYFDNQWAHTFGDTFTSYSDLRRAVDAIAAERFGSFCDQLYETPI